MNVAYSILFQRGDVQSLHAQRESEVHLSWYAAYCVCHWSVIFVHLGMGTYEEYWVFVVVLQLWVW